MLWRAKKKALFNAKSSADMGPLVPRLGEAQEPRRYHPGIAGAEFFNGL
jgi:hypothetical protein